MYPTFPSFRRQPPDTPQHRFVTLPLSVLGSRVGSTFVSPFEIPGFRHRGLGFAISQLARHNARPNRVRHPTDR